MLTSAGLREDDLSFGVECEFTDPVTSRVGRGVPARYRAACLRRCGIGGPGRWRERWWGSVSVRHAASGVTTRVFPHRDNRVLEIATEPLALPALRSAVPLLQEAVWDSCADVGLAPGTHEVNRWSMHINVSWPGLASGRDGDLLLRFLADFNDHPELALGGLGGDIRNAPPLAILGERPQQALRRVISECASVGGVHDAYDVARQIRTHVLRERFVYGSRIHNDFYHALHVCHVRRGAKPKRAYATASPVRIEIRASYMAPSAAHMLSAVEIIAARLMLLSRAVGPISYRGAGIQDPPGGRTFRVAGVQDGVTPERVAECWMRYASESGIDVRLHAPYLVNPDVRQAALRMMPRP